jgi:uncharacterized protein
MAISLYDLSVGTYLQTLGAVEGILAKGATHFQEQKGDTAAILETRLHADMLPLKFQIHSTVHHSLGAIRGVQAGIFKPPAPVPATDYAGFQKAVTEAREALQKINPEEIDGLMGKDVAFEIGDRKLPFTAEGFLQSFSLPNFFFHATTTYDILRVKGVPLGKRDFIGRMKLKT